MAMDLGMTLGSSEGLELIMALVCRKRARLFILAAQLAYPRNNHTDTVLIKSLLGPLALTSFWLTLTS